jgi:hypothetical protein
LNCFYKCISRAIANRMKKYIDKLCPRAQKGYSNTKYCQEVLIGLIDAIERCNFLGKKGCLLSLDIKKAFDSLSHSYLMCVYKFYNIGPNMIKWLVLLGTNRKASITLDSGISTLFFDLERGNAQGDTLSPFIFVLGYQLLLMKLEFDLQIQGLIEAVDIPVSLPPLPENNEVSTIPPKVYAMADDATMLVEMETGTLTAIKTILYEFELISGIGCNVEKTSLMQIGSRDAVIGEIVNLGFDIKTSVTILGLTLKSNGKCYDGNIENIIGKVRYQVRYWSRFYLSLPGRITVAKTFMYSQLTYLGCILPLNNTAYDGLAGIIGDFVNGPLRISKKRIFQSREEGGLGLMDVKLFMESQNCVWVKRAQNLNDNWKIRLYRGSNGSIFNIRAKNYNKNTEPILYNMVKNFEKFIWGHTKVNENFRKTIIFENPIIFFEGNDRRILTDDFFSNEIMIRHGQKVKNLTVDSLLRREGELVTYEEFCAEQQMVVPENKFRIILGACRNLEIRLGKTDADQKKSESILETCNRKKKLSRIIRGIWEKENLVAEIPHNIRKYSDNTEIIVNGDDSKILNDLWGFNFWDNSIKTFIFKLHNNTLGYNYMVTKHVPNVNKDCTFCELNRVGEESTETPLHLFFTCPYVP